MQPAPSEFISAEYDSPAATLANLPGPAGLPLIGNMRDFSQAPPHTVLENWAVQYGPIYRFTLGRKRIVVIGVHDLTQQILRARPGQFLRQRKLSDAIEETGFHGVFTAEGDDWRRQRRLVMQGLTPTVVNAASSRLATATARLAGQWAQAADSGAVININNDLKRYSMDAVLWLSLGIDLNATEHPDQPLQTAVDRWFGIIGRRLRLPFNYWRYFSLAVDKQAARAIVLLREAAHQAIDETRARRAQWVDNPTNILEALLLEAEREGSAFTTDHVFGNAVTMLTAGEDTTANAISWLLYYCSIQPALTEQLRASIDAALGPAPGPLDAAMIKRLPQLQAVCMEVMRRRPVAPLIGLSTASAVTVGGLSMATGQQLVLLPRVANRATPAELDSLPLTMPELDAEARMAANASTNQFAFGGGPRLCPGRYLALAEMMHVAVMALQNYDFELAIPPAQIREVFTFTMGPETMPMRLRRRNPDQSPASV